ncbi:MAG TPA: hypothetical protein VK195_08805, partial [Burkholderiaceae bacterium]|nr:hypothetical protein [Burkholderiaceae bacterium]
MHARDPDILRACRQACEQLRWRCQPAAPEPPSLLGGEATLHVVEDQPAQPLPRSLGRPTALLVCDPAAVAPLVGRPHAYAAYLLRPLRPERLKEQLTRLRLAQATNLSTCERVGPLVLDAMDRRVI